MLPEDIILVYLLEEASCHVRRACQLRASAPSPSRVCNMAALGFSRFFSILPRPPPGGNGRAHSGVCIRHACAGACAPARADPGAHPPRPCAASATGAWLFSPGPFKPAPWMPGGVGRACGGARIRHAGAGGCAAARAVPGPARRVRAPLQLRARGAAAAPACAGPGAGPHGAGAGPARRAARRRGGAG